MFGGWWVMAGSPVVEAVAPGLGGNFCLADAVLSGAAG